MTNPPPTTPEGRFASILLALCHAVAGMGVQNLIANALVVLIINRLRGIQQRVAHLVAQIQAGTFVPRRYPATRKPPTVTRPREPSKLPQKFGWLVPLLPASYGNGYRSQLLHLFRDPEMAALFAAAPAALRRPLRSLCWMMRIDPPDIFALPQKPKPPRPPRAKKIPPAAPAAPKPEQPAWMPKRTRWTLARIRGSPKTA